ncbi:mitotic spindle assembly checkpoint protein MAD2A-like [Symsagittifera roscoffensis]|uniref:mitotic spindle assembly checkpoint protein MAD2A-like n=1 Tax=Symsagittifera roscoffensis TaxID=84072 RepID=UPI00307C08C1
MATDQLSSLNLKGSTEVVCDLLYYCVHNISYLRGVYHSNLYEYETKWDQKVFVCQNEQMQKYVSKMIDSFRIWMLNKEARSIVLVLCDAITDERLERWQFDITLDDESISADVSKPVDNRKLRSQLRQLIYQIHNIMLLLPQLPDTTITLKLLIYTKENATVSEEFLETTQHLIAEPQSIDFDKVNTNIHTVKSSVQYKKDSNMTTI